MNVPAALSHGVLASRPRTDAEFVEQVRVIADEIASKHAGEVDVEARFPFEAIDALKAIAALSAFLDPDLGGAGVSLGAIAEACFLLGQRCGAAAMVFAMHQIQVVTVVRHGGEQPFFKNYLRRVAAEQRLIASATSEVGTGGDMGSSVAALDVRDAAFTFTKNCPTISYGAYADDLLTTVRRSSDAQAGDQLLVLTSAGQHRLESAGTWDPFGMRGTCSPGYLLHGAGPSEQVLDEPFASIAPQTMVPVSHIFWSHLWLGIATDAFNRSRAFVRAAAKASPAVSPPGATKLSALLSELQLLRSEVRAGLSDYQDNMRNSDWLMTVGASLRFNNLKLAASEQASRICRTAMTIAGIAGFKNDSPFAVGRHIRDSSSAVLMVANDRIHATDAGLLLIAKDV